MLKLPFESRYLIYGEEDHIVILTYRNIAVDLDTAIQIVRERMAFYDNQNYPTLVDIRNARLFTKEARDYFAKKGVAGMTALAIITGGHISVIIANLFISLSKPLVPTKTFRTREQALKWLERFKIIQD